MGKIAKNAAFLVGVLVISSAIFYLVSEDGELKDNLLERSLKLLGEQLLARLPDNEGRELVAKKWQSFSEKAVNGEIPSDQVERVAVGILNASNSDQTFSLDDADVIMSLAQNDLEPMEMRSPKTTEPLLQVEDVVVKEAEFNREKNKEECNELGEELAVICEFNNKLKESFTEKGERWQRFATHFTYRIDESVKVEADVALKDDLQSEEYKHLDEEIEELHKKGIIVWRDDFAKEMQQEKYRLKIQMDSLRIVLQAENLGDLKGLEKLEMLRNWQVLKSEEIDKIVTESMKGIDPDYKLN